MVLAYATNNGGKEARGCVWTPEPGGANGVTDRERILCVARFFISLTATDWVFLIDGWCCIHYSDCLKEETMKSRSIAPRKFFFTSLFVLVLVFIGLMSGIQPTQAVSTDVVISQVYGGGGNSGGIYTNDFIELFNRGTTTVSLAGWSVQYTSSTGTGNFGSATNLITPLSGSLAPGQYLLIQEAAGSATIAALPPPDITDATPINLSGTGGKVALVTSTTGLGCNGSSTPCTAAQLALIKDLVGWDGANFYETVAAPATTNATAVLRNGNGCTETDNNSADFTAGTPLPRNTSSPFNTCAADYPPVVSSIVPANGAVEVALNSTVVVNFSEPVNVTGSWFSIMCTNSSSHTAFVSGGSTSFTLTPNLPFVASDVCTLTVYAANVTDQDLIDPPDNMTANFTASFTMVMPPIPIHDIQGATHLSPKTGQTVKTQGIVTALRTAGGSRGFYLQVPEASYDSDPATSEGIFVYTGSTNPGVAVGDLVTVSATVSEYRGAANSLTLTELTSPTVTKNSSGNTLPAPIVIGAGGRIPPSTVIEDDATGNVETSGVFDPANDGIDFYEAMEGMLVKVNDAVVVGPRSDFTSNREIPIVGDNGANAVARTNRGGVIAQTNDFNPERIILNDWIGTPPFLPAANVGDKFPGAITGVIDYSFNNYKLQVITMPALVSGGLTQEVAPLAGAGQVSIAAFNVENLAPSDPASKFSTLAGLIINNLKSPDLLSIEEIQDNTGATDDGVVDASTTWNKLITAIQTAGGPTYQYRQIDPVNDQDGGATGGNIRVGFLYRTDRGLTFIDRPGASSTTANVVTGSGASTQLQYSPGRIDPTNAAFSTSRKPLAGEFMFQGQHLFVIANHWNSKGGDDPLFGVDQPPVLSSEVQRNQQATVVHNFVNAILNADPNAYVAVMGDLNDFQFSPALATLKGSPAILTDMIDTLPLAERYTYVYEGNSETLDHILVSSGLLSKPYVYDVVHVNSEFATQASDHEPQVMLIKLNNPPTANAGGPYSVNEGSLVTVSATGTDPENGTLTFAWDLDNNGTFETPGQSASFSGVDGPSTKTIKVQVTDVGGLTAVAQAMVNVSNVAPSAVSANPSLITINENDSITLSGSFVDPGTLDTHTVVISWGDGSSNTTLNLAAGVLSYSTTHKYLDDNPTGTPSDVNAIQVTVTDKDSASANTTTNLTVKNVAPAPTINGAPATSNEGVAISLTSATGDPGTLDTFTYAWSVTKNGNSFGTGGPAATFSFTPDDNGTFVVSLKVTDDDTSMGTTSKTITVINVPPAVSNDKVSQTAQYSDPIAAVTVTGKDVLADTPLAATTSWKKSTDAAWVAGLPSGLTFSTPTCENGTCRWTLTGKAMVAPATYIVHVSVKDKDAGEGTTDMTLIVTHEDARVTFTGALFASTASTTSSAANVTLAATIQDITAVDATSDSNPGDIRNATVTFVNRDASNATLCTATIGLANSADLKTGTTTCTWQLNLTGDSQSTNIGIVISGYYVRNSSDDDVVVTVSKPLTSDFITGGGYLVLTNSAGEKAGAAGSKANFGFNVKFNKSGKNLQGNINVIIRNGGRVYQIKGNAMDSLAVQPTPCVNATATAPCTATFNGKANIQDITDPNNPVSVDGNATLQVVMTDKGDPGSNDSMAITVWNKSGGLWFASKWDGTKTIEQTLGNGNLVVH